MTGGVYVELVLISMGWFFFAAGLAIGVRFLPGVVGSIAAFFSIPAAARFGIAVPWPWLWILLPLALDPLVWFARTRMRGSKNGSS
jgi:hypothetical protein